METLMGEVLWHVTMSLDGFIAGPNDSMDWVFGYVEQVEGMEELLLRAGVHAPNRSGSSATRSIVEKLIQSTGSVLSGRRSYNVGRKPGQRPEARKVLGGAWSGPVFVLTHKAPEDEVDPSIKFLSGGIRSAISEAREAAGGKDVLVIGADVARQCIQEGLINEIVVYLAPILLGDGVRFFNWPGAPDAVRLETIEVARSGQLTNLQFRVVK
jgi:dihydrofolate reductase